MAQTIYIVSKERQDANGQIQSSTPISAFTDRKSANAFIHDQYIKNIGKAGVEILHHSDGHLLYSVINGKRIVEIFIDQVGLED